LATEVTEDTERKDGEGTEIRRQDVVSFFCSGLLTFLVLCGLCDLCGFISFLVFYRVVDS